MRTSPGSGAWRRVVPVHWRRSHTVAALTVGAVLLRLLLFLGRGDYVAFDEGWYLLLGRNLWAGEGFTLSGLRHVALSPLFPVLAGALDLVVPSPVWAGRLVAAVSGGLLVIPAWAIFRRLSGRRTALLACAIVATLPSLAPFVVSYWIGWDLWVGAEPVLHLLLFSGIALSLRALERRRALDWLPAGAAFGFAYLARPEAVIVAASIGAVLLALAFRKPREAWRTLARPALFGAAFVLVSLPYWLYLHDVLGHWALTGRSITVSAAALRQEVAGVVRARGGSGPVERMLWQDDEDGYIRVLYGLDPSGTRLSNGYWGIAPGDTGEPAELPHAAVTAPAEPTRPGAAAPAAAGAGSAEEGPAGAGRPTPAEAGAPEGAGAGPAAASPRGHAGASGAAAPAPRRATLYARALGMVVPWFVWPLALIGLAGSRPRRTGLELLVMAPLAAASVIIALLVAIDPRTQLFLAPAVALYAARGIRVTGVAIARRVRSGGIRHAFPSAALAAVVLAVLLGINARRLYLSVSIGSPHHIVGSENRRVGRELQRLLPPDAPVMSWHPALALYADRDWRVLPFAPLDAILRYAAVNGIEYVVLSGYYPPRWTLSWIPGEYLILRVPPEVAQGGHWRWSMAPIADRIRMGELYPAPQSPTRTPDSSAP